MRNFPTEGVHFRKLLHPLLRRKCTPLEILLKLGLFAKKKRYTMVAPDKKTLKKSVKSMFFMVQTRCEVKTIKY